MLQTLKIENFALIENLSVDFEKGLNILLGETGSGKSLIFKSLLFVLGAKVDRSTIRSGKDFVRVQALFSDLSQDAISFLSELGYQCDDQLLIVRMLSQDGKNQIRINGMMATTAILKELSPLLVDFYTQHESADMLNAKNHLTMLDKFAGEDVKKIKEELAGLLQQISLINKKIKALGGDENERARLSSLLKFQYDEIEQAGLEVGEDEKIRERLKVLNNSEKIFNVVSNCEMLLSDNPDSVLNQLQEISSQLGSLSGIEEASAFKERVDSTRYELEDIFEGLVSLKEQTTFDQREFDMLDQRNDLIKSLCRKYGGSIEAVIEFGQNAKQQLDLLEDGEFELEKLEKQKRDVLCKMQELADQLTTVRKQTALTVEKRVENELKELGMKSSTFEVEFDKLEQIGVNGQDDVKFNFSANAGQQARSLAKTASGGELSRFMLAIKNIFAQDGASSTLLFDEIDAGISGETGKIVGQKLKNITSFSQILCITHLPQVAAFGDNFINVSKTEIDGQTFSQANLLQGEEIAKAIARITGGNELSNIALSHAKEMLKSAKDYRPL